MHPHTRMCSTAQFAATPPLFPPSFLKSTRYPLHKSINNPGFAALGKFGVAIDAGYHLVIGNQGTGADNAHALALPPANRVIHRTEH